MVENESNESEFEEDFGEEGPPEDEVPFDPSEALRAFRERLDVLRGMRASFVSGEGEPDIEF